jgi:glycosyltransferase involved in cell wall biosynthesis
VCGELAGARFLFLDQPGWERRLGLATLRRLAGIRFLGRGIADAHAVYGLSAPVVFPNGIACPATPGPFAARARGRPLELLYVGALARSKGIASLVRAVALCRAAACPVRLTLVGEWSEAALREEMLGVVARESLQDQVLFTGRVTGDDKWAYYNRAALLVHPTSWDGQPLTILEAMAMGLGVIATRVGAIPDAMRDGENGLLLSDAEPATVATAIQHMAGDPSRLEEIMRANRTRYEAEFTLKVYLKRMEQWLNDIQNMP